MKKPCKNFISKLALLIVSSNFSFIVHADVLKESTIDAIYHVTYRNITTGTLTQTIKLQNDSSYQFNQKISSQIAFFDFAENEESIGSWNKKAKTIQPSSYVVTGRNRLDKYQFDWDKHIAYYQKNKKKGEVALNEPVYDQLSCQLLLRAALENGAKEFICPYLNGKKIKQLHFRVVADEEIKFQNKNYHVIKVEQHNPLKPAGKKTIFWIAPDLEFMPLRVIQYKDNQQISVATLLDIHTTE